MDEQLDQVGVKQKCADILQTLLGNPSEEELRRLQLHLDVIEKWRSVTAEIHDVDHGQNSSHEHEHHGSAF